MSFTDEQLLNLVNNSIIQKTEFKPSDFTGGSVQVTSINNNRITNYKVSLFFGYKSKKPITRTIDISKDSYYIWSKALLTKVLIIENSNIGMDFSELNELMNDSNKVVSNKVVSIVESPLQVEVPVEVPVVKKSLSVQIDIKLSEYNNINVDAFEEWKNNKKYKTIGPITKVLNFLNDYSFAEQQQIVDTSIMNGWKGLFEPSKKRNRTDNNIGVAKSWLDENDFMEEDNNSQIGYNNA